MHHIICSEKAVEQSACIAPHASDDGTVQCLRCQAVHHVLGCVSQQNLQDVFSGLQDISLTLWFDSDAPQEAKKLKMQTPVSCKARPLIGSLAGTTPATSFFELTKTLQPVVSK